MDKAQERRAGGQAPQGEEKPSPKERESGVGRSSGDQDQGPRGRAVSGESYEDEADNALMRRPAQKASVKSYEGGNLGPSGQVIPGGDPSRAPARDTE